MTFPFSVEERASPDAAMDALFQRAFRSPPPSFPRHFVCVHGATPLGACAYVHFTAFEPGVYLLGGLCVDARIYRQLAPHERAAIASRGSLSRWLMESSIASLGPKRAVFAYTGNIISRRDTAVLGFALARPPYLIVQWHSEAPGERAAVVERVARLGPF